MLNPTSRPAQRPALVTRCGLTPVPISTGSLQQLQQTRSASALTTHQGAGVDHRGFQLRGRNPNLAAFTGNALPLTTEFY